jgi:hypothetical protein
MDDEEEDASLAFSAKEGVQDPSHADSDSENDDDDEHSDHDDDDDGGKDEDEDLDSDNEGIPMTLIAKRSSTKKLMLGNWKKKHLSENYDK